MLFAPGFDHAGISTQSVVEKLWRQEGKIGISWGRFSEECLGVEGGVSTFSLFFLHAGRCQGTITNQLRRLGGSYDQDRDSSLYDGQGLSIFFFGEFPELHKGFRN